MFKKIFMLGAALIMCLGLFAGCGKYVYQEGDFVLTIEVEDTTLPLSPDGPFYHTYVNVSLKNQSGKDRKISFYVLVDPHIDGWTEPMIIYYDGPPTKVMLKNLDEYKCKPGLLIAQVPENEQDYLEDEGAVPTWLHPGAYELRYSAVFWIGKQKIEVWSNTVVITVE